MKHAMELYADKMISKDLQCIPCRKCNANGDTKADEVNCEHCETTTGFILPAKEVTEMTERAYKKTVDARNIELTHRCKSCWSTLDDKVDDPERQLCVGCIKWIDKSVLCNTCTPAVQKNGTSKVCETCEARRKLCNR